MHNWSQRTRCWFRCQRFGLLDTVLVAPIFTSWLIEPGLNITLPVFVKMPIWDHIISTWSHLDDFIC
ncbi:hypothetical protein FWK35_00004875 [Aphis craccivora]|uniref:Uncharacterized protein n=1 Tax=Aphis craccivora TaxID=307492 RepID=A0A6G0YU12_APHCR|nr:hypothetical protein FWK35_00004875 [Aphis craccivora]